MGTVVKENLEVQLLVSLLPGMPVIVPRAPLLPGVPVGVPQAPASPLSICIVCNLLLVCCQVL